MNIKVMFPLEVIINIVVALAFLFYWGAVFIILYHLTRFGVGVQPKKFAVIFLLGSVVLSGATLVLFTNVDVTALIPK